MKSKAEIMRELRARRAAAGLVKVEAYVPREDKERLARYVTRTLGGECDVRETRHSPTPPDQPISRTAKKAPALIAQKRPHDR